MVRRFLWSSLTALFFALFVLSCATTIGTKAKLEDVKFEAGKTTKSEVVEVLGLPAAIEKDAEEGTELWGYHDSPELYSVDTVSFATGTATVKTNYYISERYDQFKNVAFICVFDKNGVLSGIHEQRKGTKE